MCLFVCLQERTQNLLSNAFMCLSQKISPVCPFHCYKIHFLCQHAAPDCNNSFFITLTHPEKVKDFKRVIPKCHDFFSSTHCHSQQNEYNENYVMPRFIAAVAAAILYIISLQYFNLSPKDIARLLFTMLLKWKKNWDEIGWQHTYKENCLIHLIRYSFSLPKDWGTERKLWFFCIRDALSDTKGNLIIVNYCSWLFIFNFKNNYMCNIFSVAYNIFWLAQNEQKNISQIKCEKYLVNIYLFHII